MVVEKIGTQNYNDAEVLILIIAVRWGLLVWIKGLISCLKALIGRLRRQIPKSWSEFLIPCLSKLTTHSSSDRDRNFVDGNHQSRLCAWRHPTRARVHELETTLATKPRFLSFSYIPFKYVLPLYLFLRTLEVTTKDHLTTKSFLK